MNFISLQTSYDINRFQRIPLLAYLYLHSNIISHVIEFVEAYPLSFICNFNDATEIFNFYSLSEIILVNNAF